MTTRWVLYACRSTYTAEVVEIVWRRGEVVDALVDNLVDGDLAPLVPAFEPPIAVIKPDGIAALVPGFAAAVPLITPGHRHALERELRALGVETFPALIDPSAIVARTAHIGDGTVMNAAAVVGAGTRLGRFVSVNRSASIGHDNDVADFVTLGPGCVLAGDVRVDRGAFVGAGAICAPKVHIGANAIVGAGAVVVHDVPTGAVMVGNPAEPVRIGSSGYGGAVVP